MATQESDKSRFLIWIYLGGVVVVSYLLLKVIMWMDGVK
jgi:hypothetical protein